MKSKFALLWFIVSVVLAALLAIQWRQTSEKKLALEKAQLQLENSSKSSDTRVKELERERMKLRGELIASESELASTRVAYQQLLQNTNAAASSAAGGAQTASNSSGRPAPQGANFLAKMMNNPEMKKAMEQQQRMALDMMYSSLLKKLQLSPDQEKQFKDLLLQQQMSNISQATSIMDPSSTNRAEAMQQVAADHEARQQEIKQLLGDDKFAQYEDYTQTMGERVMLDQFGKQIELKPEQTEQLLGIMREEKKNAQINGGMPKDATRDFKAIQDPSVAEKLLSQQEQVNQRVLERAGQVLTPEQLQKLGPVLQNQLDMQKAGLNMARQMFGGDNGKNGAAEPGEAPTVQSAQ